MLQSIPLRRIVTCGFVMFTLLVVTTNARADQTFNFANVSPASGSQIAYTDWQAAGRYVTFTIQPDSNYPCASEYYYLEVNGTRAGRLSNNCTASVYLSTVGSYSWRVDLYVFETGTSVTGPVSSFSVEPEQEPVVIPPAPQDTTPPRIRTELTRATFPGTAQLLFFANDNSGAASLAFSVAGNGVHWTKTLRNVSVIGSYYSEPWKPPRRGTYVFCMGAVDAAGNQSGTSCSKVIVT